MFKLSEAQRFRLAEMPEMGMGYQFVYSPSEAKRLLMSCSCGCMVISIDELHDPQRMKELVEMDEADLMSLPEHTDDLELNEDMEAFCSAAMVSRDIMKHMRSDGLRNGPPFSRTIPESLPLVRYTACPEDPRITGDGALKPKTYATTQRDSQEVSSGVAAVGRYALPCPKPAIYRQTFTIPAGTRIQFGSTLPMFARAGGGVEVFFPDGLSTLADYKKDKIPIL